MKSIVKMFSRNWGLKLLALALALIVYYSLKESVQTPSFGGMGSMKGTFNDRPQGTK